jgi:maltodextrin utilization protein YvdJ
VGNLYLSSLVEIGFLLMVVTLILNMGAYFLIWMTSRKFQEVKAS